MGGLIRQHTFRSSRRLIPGLAAGVAGWVADQVDGRLTKWTAVFGPPAGTLGQMIARRGRQAGVDAWTHQFRHHCSHTWLDRGGGEGDLVELNGWASPSMLRRHGASAAPHLRPHHDRPP
jgi:integrase